MTPALGTVLQTSEKQLDVVNIAYSLQAFLLLFLDVAGGIIKRVVTIPLSTQDHVALAPIIILVLPSLTLLPEPSNLQLPQQLPTYSSRARASVCSPVSIVSSIRVRSSLVSSSHQVE